MRGTCLAGPTPCRADHSRKNGRSLMKTHHEWTRIDTQIDGPTSTTSGTQMFLQFRVLGVTGSWNDGFLGARASRPHKAWHSLAYLPHLDRPGTAPWLPSAWPMQFPPTGWLPEASHRGSVAFKGTGCGRDARAPRAITPPLRGSRRSRAARRRLMRWELSGRRLLRKPTCTLWETPVCPRAGPQPWRAEARLNMYRARARGFESSREAAAALSRGRKPMERDATKPRAA